MISLELKKDKYLISFKGKKNQFQEYITNIMSLPDKEYDMFAKCWTVPKMHLSLIERKFKNIEYLDEVEDIKKTFKDYDSMGKNMKLTPYDYQKEAIKFGIDQQNGLIVYPCGSGKTPIGIGIYMEARERKIIKGSGMILVKASLKTQWQKEIEKFSNYKAVIIQSMSDITTNLNNKIKRRKNKLNTITDKKEIKAIKEEITSLEAQKDTLFLSQFKGVDLYILNYEALRDEDIRKAMHKIKPQYIFADEIHYVKNRTSKRSEALYEFGEAKMKIGATATPVGKNPEDIFGIFNFLSPGMFKWGNFSKLYIKYAGFGKISGFKNLDHLRKKIANHLIVKAKEDISDQLPSLMVLQRYCNLTQEQEEMHEQIMAELDALHEQEKSIRAKCKSEAEARSNEQLGLICTKILALQTFAQELADAPQLLAESTSEMAKQYTPKRLKSPKLELLKELVEEILDSGEKVCIFSRYERMQPILTEVIKSIDKNIKIAYVNGRIKGSQRYEEVYTKFRDNSDYKILFMTDAGAEGLNLSCCKYIVECDLAESYAIQVQRHGRIERADSMHDNVTVYQLLCNNSWDEIAQKIIEKKEGYDAELIKSLVMD